MSATVQSNSPEAIYYALQSSQNHGDLIAAVQKIRGCDGTQEQKTELEIYAGQRAGEMSGNVGRRWN